jgi:hypothetical protein
MGDSMRLIDEGENFRLAIWRDVAYCQVWRRPDVSPADGTRFAAVLMNALRFLLTDPESPVPGIVFDVREAPATSGPNTLALLGELIATWSLAGRNVAVVVGPEDQAGQMRLLIAQHAHGRGSVHVQDVTAALDFARICALPG